MIKLAMLLGGFGMCNLSMSHDEDKEHGVRDTRLHMGLFQRRYNGTYMQARGH